MFNFTVGIINGTRVIEADHMAQCRAKVQDKFVQNSRDLWNLTLEGEIFSGLNTLFDITYHIHSIF